VISLLARIGPPDPLLTGAGPDAQLRACVLQHLRKMCLTRRGSMVTRPDYGLPDVGEMVHSFPEAIAILRDALLTSIQRYEPRLTGVRVSHIPTPPLDLVVRFEVSAQLVTPSRSTPVRFDTRLTSSRAVTVT
jgi:type VI secretion system protein